MLYAGLDLSRKRLDFHLLDAEANRAGLVDRGDGDLDQQRAVDLSEVEGGLELAALDLLAVVGRAAGLAEAVVGNGLVAVAQLMTDHRL